MKTWLKNALTSLSFPYPGFYLTMFDSTECSEAQPTQIDIPMALFTLTPQSFVRSMDHSQLLSSYLCRTSPVPAGWIEYDHPRLGDQTYFYHPIWRIITRSNIKRPDVLEILFRALAILEARLNSANTSLPRMSEGSFAIDTNQDPPVVRYHYIDHTTRSIFWIEPTNRQLLENTFTNGEDDLGK